MDSVRLGDLLISIGLYKQTHTGRSPQLGSTSCPIQFKIRFVLECVLVLCLEQAHKFFFWNEFVPG